MDTQTIYMPLQGEGASPLAAVQAAPRSGSAFLVIGPMPADERWAFPPGSIVGVKMKRVAEDAFDLVATRLVALESDHRKFNIQDAGRLYLCPACGLPGYFDGSSYCEAGGVIGTGVCPGCRFAPGYDDDPTINEFTAAAETVIDSILNHRAAWVGDGMPWRGIPWGDQAPDGWEPARQLGHLLEAAPWIAPR